MIISQLSGGLGNQMFQYALGKQLAWQHKTKLKLDVSLYDNLPQEFTKRIYELRNFHIDAEIAQKEEIDNIKRTHLKGILKSIYWRTQYLKPYYKQNYIKERSFAFDKDILNCQDNTYLEGYWQSEKYFFSIRDILIKEFQPKLFQAPEEMSFFNKIIHSNAISIHIRRGDYISNPKHKEIYEEVPLDYYYQAMNLLNDSVETPEFFIFSDDLKWVKNMFNVNKNVTFVDIENPTSCMHLMSACKHNIIANSSFSWWGAWLNENPDKIIIAPSKWFTENCVLKDYDLIPYYWTKL